MWQGQCISILGIMTLLDLPLADFDNDPDSLVLILGILLLSAQAFNNVLVSVIQVLLVFPGVPASAAPQIFC